MSATFENLRVLQATEEIADGIWEQVAGWESFAKDTVGGQLARAVDSIGANIAESFGRFHYGEKLQFLYYARGGLFETKYWLNRALKRRLIASEEAQTYITQLTNLVRQLNAYTNSLKAQRKSYPKKSSIRETPPLYTADKSVSENLLNYEPTPENFINSPDPLFNNDEIRWLQTLPELE